MRERSHYVNVNIYMILKCLWMNVLLRLSFIYMFKIKGTSCTFRVFITDAPVVKIHYTNEIIDCDSDGFPAIYSVYLLNQISKYGELVRSVHLNNEIFTFHTFPFPYQRNGRYTCLVSNGISDINGRVLQNRSTNVIYEGKVI